MPIYEWRGIDEQGVEHCGSLYGYSPEAVEEFLHRRQVALLHITCRKHRVLSRGQVDTFFGHLASLLSSHIQLYEALTIMSASQANSDSRLLCEALARQISQGMLLSKALDQADLLDPFSHALLRVGESTGMTTAMLEEIVRYRKEIACFRKELNRALSGPLFTLSFFLVMMIVILVGVVPRFVVFFEQFRAPLPAITVWLIAFSSGLTTGSCTVACMCLLIALVSVRIVYRFPRGRLLVGMAMERLPLVGSCYKLYVQASTLKVLGILVGQRVPLSQALATSEAMTSHGPYQGAFKAIKMLVDEGVSFSAAWHKSCFSDEELNELIALGEFSGRLSELLLFAAQSRERLLQERIHKMIFYLNPSLLGLNALLIGLLLYSLYIPLINLSYACW